MNETFKSCVQLLEALAAKLNMSYEEVNIWIFVILEPIIFLLMLWVIFKQQRRIKLLKQVHA